jgi:hypothetical protein
MSLKLRVSLTQEDIDKGGHGTGDCPWFLAIARSRDGQMDHMVAPGVFWVNSLNPAETGLFIPNPAEVAEWIEGYDCGGNAVPITAEWDLTEEQWKALGLRPPCENCVTYPRVDFDVLCVDCCGVYAAMKTSSIVDTRFGIHGEPAMLGALLDETADSG